MKKILFFLISCLSALTIPLGAQNVTISPSTGNLVAAVTEDQEVGFGGGWSAMWRHEQLPLDFTVSDHADLTDGGEIANPAGNLLVQDGKLLISCGQIYDGYMCLSLPKGYSITGYRLVLANDNVGKRFDNLGTIGRVQKTVYETDNTYDYTDAAHRKAVAHIEDDENDYVMAAGNEPNREYVLERTITEITNQVYFRIHLSQLNTSYAVLTVKHFEVYFNAEGTFEADVKPETIGQPVSCFASPFNSSKIDIGELRQRTKDGKTYYAYDYRKVQDLVAYTYLYQDDAVEDGIPTDVAETKNILPLKVDGNDCFGLKNDIYYVETPVEITNASGNVAPIGYRIVGALFKYAYGTPTAGSRYVAPNYITYTEDGITYYLNTSGRFVRNTKTPWEVDENGYIHNGNIYLTYSRSGSAWFGYTYSLSMGTATSNQKVIQNGDYLRIGSNGNYLYLMGTTSATATPRFQNSTTGRAIWAAGEDTGLTPDFVPGSYTLNVYDKTGTTIIQSIDVDENTEPGYLDMGKCNNDAVKFSITNLDDDKYALISVTLLLQALDPYINKMDIVCHDDRNVLQISQPFTSNDFSVSGGKFVFYVPEDYKDDLLTFTFSNLWSQYEDDTYYDKTGDKWSRYSYVTSDYFFPVNGNGNNGLYDAAYDPDADYENKVFTSTTGNIRFKFNNAEDLSNTSGTEEEGYLEEYPFSVESYLGSNDPDGGNDKGAFIDVKLRASDEVHSGVYYVFTADETRWNIAPTTNWQHRYYAFYRMEIDLQAKSFVPELTWKKIYDNTFYDKDGEETDESMWGVSLSAKDSDTGEIVKEGYLTYQEIINALNSDIEDEDVETPENVDQLLYVDGSNLYAVLTSSKNAQVITTEDLQELLAKNAFIFLPQNTTSTLDNVAYKTASGTFRAGKDVVITDKQPFFTPYKISVDAANKATYTRLVTVEKNGQVANATVILPFTLNIADGVHTNADGSCTFSVNTMSDGYSLTPTEGSRVDYGTAFFEKVTGDVTQANVPYMVNVVEFTEDGETGKASFVAIQNGANIEATPSGEVSTIGTGVFYEGETANATFKDASYTFVNKASYSGGQFDRAKSEDLFYFANNKFLNLHTLSPGTQQYLYSFPFRSVYVYSTSNPSNLLRWFDVSYEPGETNAINDIQKAQSTIAVQAVEGGMLITSSRDQRVNVSSISGMSMYNGSIEQGDTKFVRMPAGIYVVNGNKVIVK